MTWRERLAQFANRIAGTSDPAYALHSLPVYDASQYVTTDSALTVSAVWACIEAITRSIAPAPWNVFEVDGEKRNRKPDASFAYLLNTRPNPWTTAIAFRESLLWSCMAMGGNGYAEIQFDRAGRPAALWPIEPDRVTPKVNESGEFYYEVSQYQNGTIDVDASRIFHLRGPSIYGLVGDSVIYRAAQSIALGKAAQTFGAAYFSNGTVSSGVLKHPKRVDPKAIERIRTEWAQRHSGTASAFKPVFLEEGMEWQTISSDLDKTQMLAVRAASVEDVARYFGVPLFLLGVQQSAQGYGRNLEELYLSFIRATLTPWCRRFEQEADYKLFPQRSPWRETKIDLSDLKRPDLKTEIEAYVAAHEGGLLTQNQILERLGFNTIGIEGDIYKVKTTLRTLEQMTEEPDPTSATADPASESDPEDGPDEESDQMAATMRQAVTVVVYQAIERYARAIKNRRADLASKPPDEIEKRIEDARKTLLLRLFDDCSAAILLLRPEKDVRPLIDSIAAAVEAGEPPQKAAERLVALMGEA